MWVDAVIYRPPDMRGVPPEEDVNFERVTKVYREESGKKTLVNLEADFYDHLAAYVARLDEAANAEAQKDPNSPKALLLQDELRRTDAVELERSFLPSPHQVRPRSSPLFRAPRSRCVPRIRL